MDDTTKEIRVSITDRAQEFVTEHRGEIMEIISLRETHRYNDLVVLTAMVYLKKYPKLTILQALDSARNEWR